MSRWLFRKTLGKSNARELYEVVLAVKELQKSGKRADQFSIAKKVGQGSNPNRLNGHLDIAAQVSLLNRRGVGAVQLLDRVHSADPKMRYDDEYTVTSDGDRFLANGPPP